MVRHEDRYDLFYSGNWRATHMYTPSATPLRRALGKQPADRAGRLRGGRPAIAGPTVEPQPHDGA